MTADLAAVLAGWREAAEASTEQDDVAFLILAADAMPRLVAAVEAVLKLTDGAEPVDRDYGGEPIWWSLTPAELREAITAALTGERKRETQ